LFTVCESVDDPGGAIAMPFGGTVVSFSDQFNINNRVFFLYDYDYDYDYGYD